MKKRISSIIIALFMVVGAFFPFPLLQSTPLVLEASAVLAIVNGNAAGVDEIRTLVGMFTLFATTLILGGTRPLRGNVHGNNHALLRSWRGSYYDFSVRYSSVDAVVYQGTPA
ncbi:MAG: hypothetical protein FWD48_12595, partial [Oscillospiraceae bacterium]|nr:hypothetical protein [Oscillospiraceae bacterium]